MNKNNLNIGKLTSTINKDTLIPISLAITLIIGIIYGERRINATELRISKLEIIIKNQEREIDRIKREYIPNGELWIWMRQIEGDLQEIKEKIK